MFDIYRPKYRKKQEKEAASRNNSLGSSRPESFKNPPSRTGSLKNTIDVKPLEVVY